MWKENAQILRPSVLQLAASARARSVFPVPGGPWNRTPRGGVMAKRSKTSGYRSGSDTISLSCWMCDPSPPTESNEMDVGTPSGSVSASAAALFTLPRFDGAPEPKSSPPPESMPPVMPAAPGPVKSAALRGLFMLGMSSSDYESENVSDAGRGMQGEGERTESDG